MTTTLTLKLPQRLGNGGTGSLINHLISGAKEPVPVVGMGATILCWTDRHAATIVEVSASGKRIGIKRDIATRIDGNGMSDSQEYSYAPDPSATVEYFTLRRNGAWVREGDSIKGTWISIGIRRHFHDFTF